MSELFGEEWRDIAGYAGKYQISDQGRVKSLERMAITDNATGRKRPIRERIRKINTRTDPDGQVWVSIILRGSEFSDHRKSSRQNQESFSIGELVLTAFLCPRPEGCVVKHIDGDNTNNNISNLRWSYSRKLAPV